MSEALENKVAVLVLDELATWQKLNVTAFLATGIAGAAPQALGEPYLDAANNQFARILGEPIMIYGADAGELARARRQALERDLTRVAYVRAMFTTGNDVDNRAAFLAESADSPDLVGIAVRGPRKEVDKAVKGAKLHA